MLSIQKTYVCNAPENTSVYRCKNDGTPIFKKIGIIPYQSPMIKTPESTFAKRRNDIDIGFAISPITFASLGVIFIISTIRPLCSISFLIIA